MQTIDKEQSLKIGLSEIDYAEIIKNLNRQPSLAEAGICSSMWSEHCSYRSSKIHLRRIYSQGSQVIEGPGENAGAIDIGDGWAVIFKMESHNHPSFLEPYQGAATGIGGIMRDVFAMNARPIAFLNALRFGDPNHPKTKFLLEGVVAGIGGYGNCVGVPNLGGEVDFDPSYNGNILVNAMCVGVARKNEIFRSRLETGCALLYVGAGTGRDGIQGALMASTSFEGDEASRTSVQIGDPFMQKLLLEACLEMMKTDAVIGLQDMGAAGLTSASVEMSEKSGLGVELDLDKVPTRETNMSAYEIMLSESQERMLIAIRPEAEPVIKKICDKWDVECTIIGFANDSKRLKIKHKNKIEADLPIHFLVGGAPKITREVIIEKPALPKKIDPVNINPIDVLARLLNTAELCSKNWIAEQYDQSVMGDSLQASGGDAGLVRVHGTNKALAMVADVTPRYCVADAFEGAKQAVAECFRNINAVGALPLAITDCLNFASPEDPKIMGQFSQTIDGMSQAAIKLNMPVISGNVSFYNETDGKAIMPTPAIGAVGLIENYTKAVSIKLPENNLTLLLIGEMSKSFSGQTLYQKYICEYDSISPPPQIDLEQELKNGTFVRKQILAGLICAAHDIGSGGLAVALAEMAIASKQGMVIDPELNSHFALFDETQACYIIATNNKNLEKLEKQAELAQVKLAHLGVSGGDDFILANTAKPLNVLTSIYEKFLPNLMEQ